MSHRIDRKLLCATLLCVVFAIAPAGATLFVRVPDAALVDDAPIIVRGQIRPAAVGPEAGTPDGYTRWRVVVQESWRGAEPGQELVIKVPGGITEDFSEARPLGAPSFEPGENVLLFLHQVGDGSLRILHFNQGLFHLLPYGQDSVALRNFGDAVEIPFEGIRADEERPRDLRRFAHWVHERLAGRERAADYFLEPAALRDFAHLATRFTIVQDGAGRYGRWPEFSSNQQVTFFAHQTPQPGLASGGYADFETALAAWTDDGDSNIRLRYGGLTDVATGLRRYDGINTIVFDDFGGAGNGFFDKDFSCFTGGVLAIAYPWPGSTTHTFGGAAFRDIVGGDIVTNKGLACWNGFDHRGAEQVWAHELGHTLGLLHSCGSNGPCDTTEKDEALMRSFVHQDNRGARLGVDDRRAIAFLYGAPAAPRQLRVNVAGSDVDLTWSDTSDNESGFRIRRQLGSSTVEVGEVGAGITRFIDRSAEVGETYLYSVRAFNEIGSSSPAEIVVLTGDPRAPTDLQVTAADAASISLSWVDHAEGELGFEVWGHLFGDDALLATLPAESTSATIEGLIADSEYTFKVRATFGELGNTAFGSPLLASTALAPIAPCAESGSASCLQGERFKVELRWKDFVGEQGTGLVAPAGSADSGLFYFFTDNNWEVLVKVLDGCALNQHYWVYAAATTTVEVTLVVTDTSTGKTAVYFNPLGQNAAAITDSAAFETCAASSASAAPAVARALPAAGPSAPEALSGLHPRVGGCADTAETLCLQGERFEVEITWTDFAGTSGSGKVVPAGNADSGLFYFFSPDNWEMLVKVLDGCAINQRVWVYAAATTNVAYTLKVTDKVSGEFKLYENALGNSSVAIADSGAFASCPGS